MLSLVRAVIAFFWLMVCATVGAVYSLLRFRHVNNLHPVARIFARGCIPILGLKVVRRGYETLLREGPYVIIANHQHNLDVPIMSGMLPPSTITIGKKQVMFIPFFNLIFYATGNLLIDRKNLDQAKVTFGQAAKTMNDKGARIWLFPEGTRHFGQKMGPFKKGPFHLAVETGHPLQPVVASSYAGAINLNKWNAGVVIVEALDPIISKGREIDSLMQEAEMKMQAALDRLNQEVRGALTAPQIP